MFISLSDLMQSDRREISQDKSRENCLPAATADLYEISVVIFSQFLSISGTCAVYRQIKQYVTEIMSCNVKPDQHFL
jgi:hypothetical protein